MLKRSLPEGSESTSTTPIGNRPAALAARDEKPQLSSLEGTRIATPVYLLINSPKVPEYLVYLERSQFRYGPFTVPCCSPCVNSTSVPGKVISAGRPS